MSNEAVNAKDTTEETKFLCNDFDFWQAVERVRSFSTNISKDVINVKVMALPAYTIPLQMVGDNHLKAEIKLKSNESS